MRRNMSEEKKQKRIKMREFFKQNPISSPDNLNTFFRYDESYDRRVLPR
ncbi:MAG: hypothetical protein ACRDBY_06510 [Cetobacterium sp.]